LKFNQSENRAHRKCLLQKCNDTIK